MTKRRIDPVLYQTHEQRPFPSVPMIGRAIGAQRMTKERWEQLLDLWQKILVRKNLR